MWWQEKREEWGHTRTIAEAYRGICEGGDPWIAIRNFFNWWYGDADSKRYELVHEPLKLPWLITRKRWFWAVFCAATVEYLCRRYAVPCPTWALDPKYQLDKPQTYSGNRIIQPVPGRPTKGITPEPFTQRNIICGNSMFWNKWEVSEVAKRLIAEAKPGEKIAMRILNESHAIHDAPLPPAIVATAEIARSKTIN